MTCSHVIILTLRPFYGDGYLPHVYWHHQSLDLCIFPESGEHVSCRISNFYCCFIGKTELFSNHGRKLVLVIFSMVYICA